MLICTKELTTMLENINPENLIFLDIETVSQKKLFTELDETWQELWTIKTGQLNRRSEGEATPDERYNEAAIYAEFGKIICISVGAFRKQADGTMKFHLKSFAGHDEKQLLLDFADMLNNRQKKGTFQLVAHNGKEFDFPYIARRMTINRMKLPVILDIPGKKPWDLDAIHIDTMTMWKFGDFKSFTSLKLLAATFGIPSPKDDIDGSEIYHVYWNENDLQRIVTYCQKDVLTVAQVFRGFRGEELIDPANVVLP